MVRGHLLSRERVHGVWVGRGLGFDTMFLVDLVSVFLYLAGFRRLMVSRACLYAGVCVRGPFGALLRIFNIVGVHRSPPMLTLRGLCGVYGFLTYLFAIPLFPHAPWPSHTLCLFFPSSCPPRCLESMEEWGDGCYLCLYACFMTCVVVSCSFLRAMLSLWRPPSQHTLFSSPAHV